MLQCSWMQASPCAESLLALGFSEAEVSAAAICRTCDVLTSFVYQDECLLVVNISGDVVVIESRLVQLKLR